MLWWGSRERIERLVRVEGLEHCEAVAARRVILLAPHFVGLDMGGDAPHAAKSDMVSIYAKQKNPVFDAVLLRRGRIRFGDQRCSRARTACARRCARCAGRPFYYLPDQDYGPRDAIFVPFFGVPAATITGVSRMARIARRAVMPCVTRMLPGGAGYVLRIVPAWENFPAEDVEADTRRMNAFIERAGRGRCRSSISGCTSDSRPGRRAKPAST